MMASRRRHPHRRRSWSYGDGPVAIRVSSRRSTRKYFEMQATGARDAGRFARIIEDQVHDHPQDPIIIAINGYQPWLGEVLDSALEDYWPDLSDLDREVQFAGTMQFPEKANKRGQCIPWTFIMDNMNVPQVYYWSVGLEPPVYDDFGLPSVNAFKFRVGVWQMGRKACRLDPEISVTIIFTRPDEVSEHVTKELLFDYLHKDDDFSQPREDEEGICWIFSRLYWLLTDWQNIIQEVATRLDEAEYNSHGRHLPVKLRARMMHNEVDRIFEMKEYLNFHTRAFKKLQKLKDSVPANEQSDALWGEMDDALEDLDQYSGTMDSLKERFNNLLDLEFNIQNAEQSDNSDFLSTIATLFLPISFLASLFGITTVTWPVKWYLYAALPIFILSGIFTAIFPWSVRKYQKHTYPLESIRIRLRPGTFTMLGDELPESADVPGATHSKGRRKSQRVSIGEDASRRRGSRSRPRGEKGDG